MLGIKYTERQMYTYYSKTTKWLQSQAVGWAVLTHRDKKYAT